MDKVTVDTSDLGRIFSELNARAQSIPMAMVAAPFVTAIDDEIQSQGKGKWPPFADATLRMHPRRKGGKLLQDTGQLAQMQVDEQDAIQTAFVFSPADYAWKHANGYKRIPKRDYLDIDMDGTAEIACMAIVQEICAGG